MCSVKLKVLKYGGLLSQSHSVCVPNKLTQLQAFPLKPDEAGFIYYSKTARDKPNTRHKVRLSASFDPAWRLELIELS